MFIILFSSCIQSMPSVQRLFGGRGRGGYHRVGAGNWWRSNLVGTIAVKHGVTGWVEFEPMWFEFPQAV